MRFARHCVSIFFLGWLQFPLIAQPTVKVIYPQNGQQIFATDSTFVFGTVLPATAKFTINSKPVTLYPNGAFLSMLPLTSKETRLDCRAVWENDTTHQFLTVIVPDYLVTSSFESLEIDTTFIFPATDLQLLTGDMFRVVLKGTPGGSASFTIAGLVANIPMVEVAAEKRQFWGDAIKGGVKPSKGRGVQGVYTGLYKIGAGDEIDHASIYFKLVRNSFDSLVYKAHGTLTIQNSATLRLVQLPATFYEPHIKPGFNAMVFLPEKLKIAVTAQDNSYYRLQLANDEFFWLRSDSLPLLPCKPGNEIPAIGATTIKNEDSHTLLSVQLNVPVPIKIEAFSDPVRLVLTFWGVQTNWNRILDLQLIPHVRKAEWLNQPTLHQLVIELNQKQLLGYRPAYETNQFILELKNPPESVEWPGSPLKNIIVALDPGHNPDLGAVGPTGLIEKDVNLEVCHRLKRHLEEKEAMVVLTRDEEQGVALSTRPKLAAFVSADVLISVHFNSLPDGVNPYRNRGTSTYYFQPMSYPLACLIHENLLEALKLADFGLFHQNLVLIRPTELLAVLIEPAFIIHPEEELLIRTAKFQETLAQAVVTALEEFYQTIRE